MQASEPPAIGRGHPEYHFVQAIMELKTTIHQMDTEQKVTAAKMEVKLEAIAEQVKATNSKLSGVEADVSGFKRIQHTAKVVGWLVGVTCALLLGMAGYVTKEVWSVVKPSVISAITQPAPAPQEPRKSDKK
jgi:hypothetical protein